MLVETDPQPRELKKKEELVSREELRQMLKAQTPGHPALNRVHAKLVASAETEIAISSYDRMHHRHSRS